MRAEHPALRRGKQVTRSYNDTAPGLVSFSRFDPETGAEYLLAFNTSDTDLSELTYVKYDSHGVEPLHGACTATQEAIGSVHVSIPRFGWCLVKLGGGAE